MVENCAVDDCQRRLLQAEIEELKNNLGEALVRENNLLAEIDRLQKLSFDK